jgi:WD40 repeat protein
MLATTSERGVVKLWSMTTFQELASLTGHLNAFNSVTFSRDGRRLCAGSSPGQLFLWDITVSPPQEVGRLNGHTTTVYQLAFLGNDETLISVSETDIRAWRTGPFAGFEPNQQPLRSQ